MACGYSSNPKNGGIYERNMCINHEQVNNEIVDMFISVSDDKKLLIKIFGIGENNVYNKICLEVDPTERENFIKYLRQVAGMLERKKD